MSFNLFKREKESEKKTLDDFIRKDESEEENAEEVVADETIESEKEEEKVSEKSESDNLTALGCFGWKEEKTEKWLAKCAKVWFLIMSLLYFLFGALTFAPIIFIKNKVNSVVSDKKMSLIIAIAIYAVTVLLFAIFIGVRFGSNVPPAM
jgi:hypothetical protein